MTFEEKVAPVTTRQLLRLRHAARGYKKLTLLAIGFPYSVSNQVSIDESLRLLIDVIAVGVIVFIEGYTAALDSSVVVAVDEAESVWHTGDGFWW